MSNPTSIYNRIRETLVMCDQFKRDDTLRAIFVDERIYPWRDSLPSALSVQERVQKHPGLSELLDWVGYLQVVDMPAEELETLPHIGALLKLQADQNRAKEAFKNETDPN